MVNRMFLVHVVAFAVLATASFSHAQTEEDYYRIVTIPIPDDVALEVGGLAFDDRGRPIVCTRRGEVFIIDGTYTEAADDDKFNRFAFGLHEPLGLLRHDGWLYTAQRGEITRMKDADNDGRADVFENFCDQWEISGNYHEYTFGPVLDHDGNLWVTLNKPFGGEPFGHARWRGWAMKIDKNGHAVPAVCGLRSPAGLAVSPMGDLFYTDNQGEWVATNKLAQLEEGDFHGHPHGIGSAELPRSPIKPLGRIPSGVPQPEFAKAFPTYKLPAVWFPYKKMGQSASDIVWDTTGGKFGLFKGQMLVADQHSALIMRVFLEKINGKYQGAAFPFRKGFQCGILRMKWGKDHSLFVGETNRGWGGFGNRPDGLQRLVWTGKTPFEIHEMRLKQDGFELTFTEPVDARTASDIASYKMISYTYFQHSKYGSPEIDTADVTIKDAQVSKDRKSVHLICDGLRAGYVHELHLPGVRNDADKPLLHGEAYYTLNDMAKPLASK